MKAHGEAAQKVLTHVSNRKKAKFFSDDHRSAKARKEMENAYTISVAEEKKEEGATVLGLL